MGKTNLNQVSMSTTSITRKLLPLLFAILFSSIECLGQNVVKVDTAHYLSLRIDPSNAMGGNISDVFSEVNYIPLETTPESLFGTVSRLGITDKYYIILDDNTNSVLLFDKTGKFHAKIKGKSSSIADRVISMVVNRWTKRIICTGYSSESTYDFDCNLIETNKRGPLQKNQINLTSYQFFSADSLINADTFNDVDKSSKDYTPYSRFMIQYVTANKNAYAAGLKYSDSESKIDAQGSGIWPLTSFGSDTSFFYSKAYANSIYTITPHTIKLSYKIFLPLLNSVPTDFLSNSDYTGKRLSYLMKNQSEIYAINNFYKVNNNLLFEATSAAANDEDNLIYNLHSGSLIAYKHIQPDMRSFNLPIYEKNSANFENNGLVACDGKYIYTSISSLGMFKAKDLNKTAQIKYNEPLTLYFQKSTRKDNPVLVQLKLKDEL